MSSLVKQRLDNPQFVSEIELDVSYAIDKMRAPKNFVMGYVADSDILFYLCKRDDNQRFCIEKATKIKHQIGKLTGQITLEDVLGVNLMFSCDPEGIYSFDPYFDKYLPDGFNEQLAKQFDNGKMAKDVPYYLVDKAGILGCHAVRYALQTKTSSHVILMESYDRDAFRREYRHAYILPDELHSVPICLFHAESNLELYCKENQELFCVPLDNITLNAQFWGDKTWKDLLPNEHKDASIGEIPLKYITLKTYVDGFQNIYVSVSDLQGNNKNIVLKLNEKTM